MNAHSGNPKAVLKTPQLVLIDVDGTLVDSVPDLSYCVDALMRELALPERGEASVRRWVGNGVERLVRRALTNTLDGEPDAKLFARAYPLFLDLYAANTSQRSRLYPGVLEALAYLKKQGWHLGCVTNKAKQFTEPLLKALGIFDEFGIIISGDSLPKSKPDPMPLLHAAQFFNVRPEDALMIGDSVSDVKAARAAGFAIVCMSYGYNHGEDIRSAHPDAVIDRMDDIQALLGHDHTRA